MSFCPGPGVSAMGHRSHSLTLPVLAAQSPVGLENTWKWAGARGWHVTVMSGETQRGGGGGVDAILQQARVHQGWQRAWDLVGWWCTQLLVLFQGL